MKAKSRFIRIAFLWSLSLTLGCRASKVNSFPDWGSADCLRRTGALNTSPLPDARLLFKRLAEDLLAMHPFSPPTKVGSQQIFRA
jgi:hypothetical protein